MKRLSDLGFLFRVVVALELRVRAGGCIDHPARSRT